MEKYHKTIYSVTKGIYLSKLFISRPSLQPFYEPQVKQSGKIFIAYHTGMLIVFKPCTMFFIQYFVTVVYESRVYIDIMSLVKL